MKVVVFGGSGFLGSHVADALTDRGYDVIVYDINESPYLQKNQRMIVGDILDKDSINEIIKGVDYVYNFAGLADLDTATTSPIETANQNILGNLNILEAACKQKVKRFIYASTIYVYSQMGGFYRCSKQSSELYVEEYQKQYGIDYTILRYGTLYGPRSNMKNSVYRYLMQALKEKRIVALGDGEEIREYINITDAAKLSVDILDKKHKNQHIIITGHHPMKYKEMLLMIKEILGGDVKIEFNKTDSNHYKYTPYSFIPKIGNKLVSNEYIDMGQGLLECLHEIHDNNK